MKKIISFIALLSLSSVVFSFEWPVENISVKSIISFFGQLRGNTMSTSLVIEKPELKEDEEEAVQEVRSCETGRVLTYLYAFDDDNDFFPSTLGNAVIIEHEDNIISVYGNLAQTEISNSKTINPEVLSGAKIAQTGNSGWQEKLEKKNGVEIQIIDSKNKAAINPRVIFPRLEKENVFVPAEIIFENKDGKKIDISQNRSVQAGVYKVYQKRNSSLVPQKISLSLNGNLEDEYSFNSIVQENNANYINTKTKKYPGKIIYPDTNLLFVGEVKLSAGKSVLTFENTNHLGDKKTVTYSITVY